MGEHFRSIGIIGYGRFGRLVEEILKKHGTYSIKISSSSNPPDGETFHSFEEVAGCDLVIPCVPIRNFEETIVNLSAEMGAGQTVVDVCSVKSFPRSIMLEHLSEEVQIICSHPMFGPSTYASRDGQLSDLNMVIENVRANDAAFAELKSYLTGIGLNVVEMSADEHDKLAAHFHFITLLAADLLKEQNIKRSAIDTKSASVMMDFLEMISTDRELVKDMYEFNPYCVDELDHFDQTYREMVSFLKGE